MIKSDIEMGVPYAVKTHTGHQCVIVVSKNQRVMFRSGPGPIFKAVEKGRIGIGYPIVEIREDTPEALLPDLLKAAQSVTMKDVLEAEDTQIKPGVILDYTANFAVFEGPYDEVMAKLKAEREARETHRRQLAEQKAEAVETYNGLVRRMLNLVGYWPGEWSGDDSPAVRPHNVPLSFEDMDRLLKVGEAAQKLFELAENGPEGGPAIVFSDQEEAVKAFDQLMNILLPF